MSGLFRRFFDFNQRLSLAFDTILPQAMSVYGTTDFHASLLPAYLPQGGLVYDIGGGKRPHVFPDIKAARQLRVIGVDIDGDELARAPQGAYDDAFVADITHDDGRGDGDAVLLRSVLEHVDHNPAAFRHLPSYLKPGGLVILYAPCRNAIFARLNLLLPENLKNRLLEKLYGRQAEVMGFKAYYDHCTLSELSYLARANGFEILEKRVYWMSNYFSYFTPLHILWRLYQLIVRPFFADLAEGQALVLRKI